MTFLASHPILAVLLFLAILIFVHETGHFIVGKLCGIGVEIYSIGFGPKLFAFERDGTEYRLSVLPLGGFVKFAGAIPSEDVPEYFKGKEMYRAPVWARALTIMAGPVMNLLLAMVIFSVQGYQGIEHPASIVGTVMQGGAAEKAGILAGDRIVAVNEEKIFSWNDLRESIAKSPGKALQLQVERQEKILSVSIVPETYEGESFTGEVLPQGRVGISYGLVPPIVSKILDPEMQSAASLAGINIGDRIQEVSYVGVTGVKTSSSIRSWSDFLLTLQQAYEGEARELEVTLIPAVFVAAGKSSDSTEMGEKERTLLIKTHAWQILEFGPKVGSITKQTLLAKSLGLTDSQLTIAEVKEPLKGQILRGDKIVSLNGKKVTDIFALSKVFQDNKEAEISMEVMRANEIVSVQASLKPIEIQKAAGKEIYYQFNAAFLGQNEPPPPYVEIGRAHV